MTENKKIISIEGTKFIFRTNFSGDPERDSYGSTTRKGNIILPDEEVALSLKDEGFNVKLTKPRAGEEEGFIPRYYVSIILNYDAEWPPKVYIINSKNVPILLNEETVGKLDKVYVKNVDVILNPYRSVRNNRNTLYVKTMYVEQNIEEDPFAGKYFVEE